MGELDSSAEKKSEVTVDAKKGGGAHAPDPDELLKLQKEIWEKTIDTQMHFNEMSVRSRQLGLSFVVASLGVVVVLLTKDEARLSFHGRSVHVAGLILFLSAFALWAVELLDLGVYHKMLRGAVAFNEVLEQDIIKPKIMKTVRGLTEAISLYSRYPKSRNLEQDGPKQTAEARVRKFYRVAQVTLILIGLLLTWVTAKTDAAMVGAARSKTAEIDSAAESTAKANRRRPEVDSPQPGAPSSATLPATKGSGSGTPDASSGAAHEHPTTSGTSNEAAVQHGANAGPAERVGSQDSTAHSVDAGQKK